MNRDVEVTAIAIGYVQSARAALRSANEMLARVREVDDIRVRAFRDITEAVIETDRVIAALAKLIGVNP